MESGSVLKLDNQLCFAVYACAREITKLYSPLLKKLGLTYTQYVTLLALWEQDRVSVKQLGIKLYLDSGTLTPLLKKLEGMGLVTRMRDQQDERSVIITLTEQGAKLQERAAEVPMKAFCQTGIVVEEAEALRKQVADMLLKLQRAPS